MVKVLLFGRLRDVAGWRERDIDPSPSTLATVRRLIIAETPALEAALAAPGVQSAVDRSLVKGDCALPAGAEVAFMPAMSGG